MSKTVPLICGDEWVWALDDAFSVYLAYLAEALESGPAATEPWVSELVESLKRCATLSDHAATVDPTSDEQHAIIRAAATEARRAALGGGDVSREALTNWTFDAGPVSAGFSRTGDFVELHRILEVADALEGMLDGNLPVRAPYHRWWVGTGEGFGTGEGWRTIEMLEP